MQTGRENSAFHLSLDKLLCIGFLYHLLFHITTQLILCVDIQYKVNLHIRELIRAERVKLAFSATVTLVLTLWFAMYSE